MNVHKLPPKPQFMPVNLVLETQEEVDAICAIVNSQQITRAIPVLDGWHYKLEGYGDFKVNWNELVKVLRT